GTRPRAPRPGPRRRSWLPARSPRPSWAAFRCPCPARPPRQSTRCPEKVRTPSSSSASICPAIFRNAAPVLLACSAPLANSVRMPEVNLVSAAAIEPELGTLPNTPSPFASVRPSPASLIFLLSWLTLLATVRISSGLYSRPTDRPLSYLPRAALRRARCGGGSGTTVGGGCGARPRFGGFHPGLHALELLPHALGEQRVVRRRDCAPLLAVRVALHLHQVAARVGVVEGDDVLGSAGHAAPAAAVHTELAARHLPEQHAGQLLRGVQRDAAVLQRGDQGVRVTAGVGGGVDQHGVWDRHRLADAGPEFADDR